MHALARYTSLGCLVLLTFACSDKGDDGGDEPMGGTGGGGGGGSTTSKTFGFDADVEGWKTQYVSSDTAAGIDPVPIESVLLEWTDAGSEGGGLRATIPYTSKSQYVGFGVSLSGEDMTGKTLRASIQLVSGLDADVATYPGGAKIYAKSGMTYVYANGAYNNIDATGTWKTISFILAAPDFEDTANGMFDEADVREIGLQIDTGGMGMAPLEAVVLIDTFTY